VLPSPTRCNGERDTPTNREGKRQKPAESVPAFIKRGDLGERVIRWAGRKPRLKTPIMGKE
jgi:hypothetical protein